MDSARSAPQQARSRETAERIVVAALDLLGERTFDEMTVADIAGRAGVSVGGFYGRFPGKDALLEHLNVTVIGGMAEVARRRLAPEATADLALRDLVRRYVAMVVEVFRENRAVLRQITTRARTSTDAGFSRRISDTNRIVHDLFRDRLHERLDAVAHPDPRRAIDIALTAVSGAMREYVLFDERRPHFDPVQDADLVVELTDLFCAYLRVDP